MRIVDKSGIPDNDKMRTICEHIAIQISAAAPYKKGETMLVTGGGAYNTFLMERIKALCPAKIVIPDNKTVEFKEALIFRFPRNTAHAWRNKLFKLCYRRPK